MKFLKVVDLKKLCRVQGITTTGNKSELIDKLVVASAAGKKTPGWGKGEDPLPDAWARAGKGAGGGKGGLGNVDAEQSKEFTHCSSWEPRHRKPEVEKSQKTTSCTSS